MQCGERGEFRHASTRAPPRSLSSAAKEAVIPLILDPKGSSLSKRVGGNLERRVVKINRVVQLDAEKTDDTRYTLHARYSGHSNISQLSIKHTN